MALDELSLLSNLPIREPIGRVVVKGNFMRIGLYQGRSEKDGAVSMKTLPEALAAMLEYAEPMESIEVPLSEAIGLVLAEPAIADVDLPPFDRVAFSGYAVRASETIPGTLLRVAAPWSELESDGQEIEFGETAQVEAGDPLPVGADAVLGDPQFRTDSNENPARVIEVLANVPPGRAVVLRGATLAAGSILAEAGTRIRPAMIPLLAAQGCVHPICHRRVRVSILAVGEHLIAPGDAPVLHHERNAANLAIAALLLGSEAMVHDLGALSEANFASALDRALNAPVVLILGRITGGMYRALAHAGVIPTVSAIPLEPAAGTDIGHAIVRDAEDRVVAHVVHLPLDPVAALTVATLVVLPLIARLQGSNEPSTSTLRACWDATQPATSERLRAVPATLAAGADGRLRARPVVTGGPTDLPDLAQADGLALFPSEQGPWHGGEIVEFAPFTAWQGRIED